MKRRGNRGENRHAVGTLNKKNRRWKSGPVGKKGRAYLVCVAEGEKANSWQTTHEKGRREGVGH